MNKLSVSPKNPLLYLFFATILILASTLTACGAVENVKDVQVTQIVIYDDGTEEIETEPSPFTWEDLLNDGINCKTGEPLGEPTPPEIDIGSVVIEWLNEEELKFVIEFPRVETIDYPILGSFEFDDPSVPNSNPSENWYFSGRGEADGNYYYNPPDPIYTEVYFYEPDQGWVENEDQTIVASIDGNQIVLIVPVENFPYLESPYQDNIGVWTGVTTPDFIFCDSALLNEEGQATGWLPAKP